MRDAKALDILLSRYVRQIAPNPRAGPRGINY